MFDRQFARCGHYRLMWPTSSEAFRQDDLMRGATGLQPTHTASKPPCQKGSSWSTCRPTIPNCTLRLQLHPAPLAETLWTLVDEPVVNTFIPSLDKLIDTITERCSNLTTRQPEIGSRINLA